MITLEMIKKGYDVGLVRVIDSPLGDGVACSIGDDWFYFKGLAGKESSAEEYQKLVPVEDIVRDIHATLECFWKDRAVFEDEYLYYHAFLTEKLKDVSLEPVCEQAARLVKENCELAHAVFRVVDRMYEREDIVTRIKEHGSSVLRKFSDAEIDIMAERFHEELENNDRLWAAHMFSADKVVADAMREKGIFPEAPVEDVFIEPEVSDKIVDDMLGSIQRIGGERGSGYFTLKLFAVDGQAFSVVAEVCKFEDEKSYFGIYSGVCQEDGEAVDNSFDWQYTAELDVDALKRIVFEIANGDYTNDVRNAISEKGIGEVLADAEERSVESGNQRNVSEEYVK